MSKDQERDQVKRWPDVQGIKGTARRCKAENLGVTEYQLRMAIRSGELPVRRPAGSKCVLIYWPNVLAWISCKNGQDNLPPQAVGGIVPVY